MGRRPPPARAETLARRRMLGYLSRHGDDLSFTEFFWKGCEPNDYELGRFSKYVRVMLRHGWGKSAKRISRDTQVSSASVDNWVHYKAMPKLAHYLSRFVRLGKPRSRWVWLSINNGTGHAIPLGPFLQVPQVIRRWKDVETVLDQLHPVQSSRNATAYRFGFLLGITIGDASKKRQKEYHRHLELVLSKKYRTNLKIGDFASECARSIGIRMERARDRAPYGTKPNGFYVWSSQSTALIDWLFNVCLGLKDDELTTYSPVKMEWVLDAPAEFRRGLVQGLAESDGSVSIASQTVEFWIGPNWDFVSRLLLSFGVSSFRNREALSVTKNQIKKLYEIPAFSPILRTVRYDRFERLARARHIEHGRRIPRKIREAILQAGTEGMSIPRISVYILDRFGIVLSFEAVQRWARRTRV
ncbi:MAG: hypothetical protein LYZ66_00330 [Nitrososphaerales archaeon]|nr:hypothetical protein [Nitrososphaerales archaeon]